MNPTKEKYYRGLFLISALYDSVLGCVFTFFPAQAFTALGIREKLPEFGGYISLLDRLPELISGWRKGKRFCPADR